MYYQPTFQPDEVILYLRKSRSDDPLLTVEEVLLNHETILDEWCEKHLGTCVPEENKYREVVSGETLAERPKIQLALRRIESPKIKAIAVVDPQRLTRGDWEDISRLMKLLKITRTIIITPQRYYDLSEEYDWDSFERELKRGNDYLEYTKKILNRGRLLSVSQGNYIGSIPPYGYDKTWIMDGKRKCPTLVENKEQADVVRMIFNMYVKDDMGRNSICNRLDELGIKPPKGEHWSAPALKDMLANVHYIGKVRWNWRKTKTIVQDSVIINTRPKAKMDEYLIYEGKHEAIIPEELFWAAIDKQGRNHRAKPNTKVRNPLASILYCQCGRAMSLRIYKRDGKERSAPRLLCDGQIHCHTGSCLYDEMIERVCNVLEQCIADFELQLKNNNADTAKEHSKLINSLEKKLHDLEAKELAQWEAQAHPDASLRMPPAVFKQLNEKLLLEKETVQKALRKAYEAAPEPIDYKEKIIRFKDALSALQNPDVSAQEKNRLLKTCIERIEYTREAPERLTGIKGKDNGLKVGGNWSNPPFTIDVKLKA